MAALALCLIPPLGQAQATRTNTQGGDGFSASRQVVPPAGDYVIGPDDVLGINVWKENEVSRELPVRPDGKISLPLVGELQASGQTPLQ
ncbi:MAG TPA: polysaccharide biosynthesis/export family protein, partial [Terriglobales bacterium]|nr:polysaccharide biosynthesis/export family protein [Terriglobales bacterium]